MRRGMSREVDGERASVGRKDGRCAVWAGTKVAEWRNSRNVWRDSGVYRRAEDIGFAGLGFAKAVPQSELNDWKH